MKELKVNMKEYMRYQRHVEKFSSQYFDSSIKLLNSGHLSMKLFDRPMKKKRGKNKAEKDKLPITELEQLAWTRKNRQRSMQQFIELLRHNSDRLVSFGTLTFDPKLVGDDFTRDDALRYWNIFATRVRKDFPDVAFVKVDEKHKSGRTHFHFVSTAPLGHELFPFREPKKLWNKKSKKYYTLYSYDIPYWDYGFSDVKDMRTESGQVDENFDAGLYMAKYMAKNFKTQLDEPIGRYHEKKYTTINSHLLERPETINFNREFKDIDIKIMEWLEAKGYILGLDIHKDYIAPKNDNGTMAPNFYNYKVKLERNEIIELKELIKNLEARPDNEYKTRERNLVLANSENDNLIGLILPIPQAIDIQSSNAAHH